MQEKAIAFPTDSRLLDMARRKVVLIATGAGLEPVLNHAIALRFAGYGRPQTLPHRCQ